MNSGLFYVTTSPPPSQIQVIERPGFHRKSHDNQDRDREIERLRDEQGMTWSEIGVRFGMTDSGAAHAYGRRKERGDLTVETPFSPRPETRYLNAYYPGGCPKCHGLAYVRWEPGIGNLAGCVNCGMEKSGGQVLEILGVIRHD